MGHREEEKPIWRWGRGRRPRGLVWFGAYSGSSYSCLMCLSLPSDSAVFTSKAGPEGRATLFPQCERAGLCQLPNCPPHTHTRARRHAQGITEGKQKKQPEMWTLGTELTLLGKQKVGSSVPRWVLGLAKSRVFVSSFLCDTPTPLVPKVKQLRYKHQTPRHPFSCLWADAQGILQIGECFWGQGTKRKRLRSLPGW